MSAQAPGIRISQDLQIGYQSPLAFTREEIQLGPGNHFLLGRNGRGKTTLLRTLAKCLRPLGGHIECSGTPIYLSEDLEFDRELTSSAAIKALLDKSQVGPALTFAEQIDLALNKPFAELSTGNKRKLCLIISEFTAAALEAPILLLDEPYTGLDDHTRSAIRDLWEKSADSTCRLIVAHPDQDDFLLPSALTISSGEITQLPDAPDRPWSEVRQQLA